MVKEVSNDADLATRAFQKAEALGEQEYCSQSSSS